MNELAEIFDVLPVKTEKPERPVVVVETTTADADIDFARANLKTLMETCAEALSEALEVAKQSEAPRAYEVVTQLIAVASELNNKLIASHKTQQTMKTEVGGKTPANVTNNNVIFSGTPAELSAHLKRIKANESTN